MFSIFAFYYYGPYGFYFDRTILIVIPFILLASLAQIFIKNAYAKYSNSISMRGYTGAEACRRMLDQKGLYNVRVEKIAGTMTDHYDPRSKVIRLSDGVFAGKSLAAISIACHEAGHAYQDADGYAFLRLRNAIIPATNFGSRLAFPLIFFSFILPYRNSYWLAMAGVLCFSLSVVFQLLTLPTEFDASKRALRQISEQGLLATTEISAGKKILTAAALTYVAALGVGVAQLFRLLLLTRRRYDD